MGSAGTLESLAVAACPLVAGGTLRHIARACARSNINNMWTVGTLRHTVCSNINNI